VRSGPREPCASCSSWRVHGHPLRGRAEPDLRRPDGCRCPLARMWRAGSPAGLLVSDRRQVIKRGMAAPRIVPAFDEVEDGEAGVRLIAEAAAFRGYLAEEQRYRRFGAGVCGLSGA